MRLLRALLALGYGTGIGLAGHSLISEVLPIGYKVVLVTSGAAIASITYVVQRKLNKKLRG